MNNRKWISSMCIYDFLCHINQKGIAHCIVTRCKGHRDYDLCMKHQSECKECIQEFLNTERRCVK